jgi:glucoamylase
MRGTRCEVIMPRDIPVGNGKFLVCFDHDYLIRDLYFPHVGMENHVGGNYCHFGVWVDGQFSWMGTEWEIDLRYLPDTLVTDVTLLNSKLGIKLFCQDAVDFHENVFLREITVENLKPDKREVRLFFALSLDISGASIGNTAAYDPESGGVVHYKEMFYFLANGKTESSPGLTSFAVGQKGIGNLEGTFKDAEDGVLSENPIAQGIVDSVISVSLQLESGARGKAYFWIAAATTWDEVRHIDTLVKERGPESLISRTLSYWRLWILKENPQLDLLPHEIGDLYRRSLLVVRTQVDWQGGIIAANDSDVVRFNRDTYSYVWPRDGALVGNALDQAGYRSLAQNFYNLMAQIIGKDGYLLHRYNPDGTLASSWHPWWSHGHGQLPIQEDETALVIWALWHHFVYHRDVEFIKPLYKSFIKRAGDFLCSYRDKETGLPGPSYDLWEERRGILSFTVAAVFGGITAASLFCSAFGEDNIADSYMKSAAEIRDAATSYLWQRDLNRFCRMVYRNDSGELKVDSTRDSSLWGLFAFGMYSADDPKIVSTMTDLRDNLWVKEGVGGMARYEGDEYYQVDKRVPGNPWFLCTLWLADFLAETAEDERGISDAVDILQWVAKHALPSGVLAEQVHPFTGEPLSVSPLTWSHSTFVATVHRILRRKATIVEHKPKEHWIEKSFSQACDSIYGVCRVD